MWPGIILILSTALLSYSLHGCTPVIDEFTPVQRVPVIRPDYRDTVIPPNIAPLNFVVKEQGSGYYVKIYSAKGNSINVFSRSPKIVIPEHPWHRLLNMNRGQELYFDVFVKTKNDQWDRFDTITNKIAYEDIDGFLVYRKIHPAHYAWRQMGIYQRNLHNYDESLVLDNKFYKDVCLNCHSFCGNRPDKMLISIRSGKYGNSTLLVEDGAVNKLGTKFTYTSWHPSGRLAVYSFNKVRQFWHSARNEIRDVLDIDSLLAYYLVDLKTVKTSPKISRKDRLETYPTWSPDGRYLYFCSAPMPWSDESEVSLELCTKVKYDLVRVSYELNSDNWGEPETILSSMDTGLSVMMPRISPDGRWLLFSMCNYGCFPAYQKSSDLYLMDLKAARQTGEYKYRRLDINSDQSESWHSWSSNSRWIAFSSKRQSGVFTRSYFSYVDEVGRVYKPVLMPQKDPLFYDSCLKTYSVPELVIAPVKVTGEKLARATRGLRQIAVDMPITMATPKAGTTPAPESWQEKRE